MHRNYALTLTLEDLEGIKGKGNVRLADLPKEILECEGVPRTGIGSREQILPKVKRVRKGQKNDEDSDEQDDGDYVEVNEQDDEGHASAAHDGPSKSTRSKVNRGESDNGNGLGKRGHEDEEGSDADEDGNAQVDDGKRRRKEGGKTRMDKEKGKSKGRRKDSAEEDEEKEEENGNSEVQSSSKSDSGLEDKEDDDMDADVERPTNISEDGRTNEVEVEDVAAGKVVPGVPRGRKRSMEESESVDGQRSKSPPKPSHEDEGERLEAPERRSRGRSRAASVGPSLGSCGAAMNMIVEEGDANDLQEIEVIVKDRGKTTGKRGARRRRNGHDGAQGAH